MSSLQQAYNLNCSQKVFCHIRKLHSSYSQALMNAAGKTPGRKSSAWQLFSFSTIKTGLMERKWSLPWIHRKKQFPQKKKSDVWTTVFLFITACVLWHWDSIYFERIFIILPLAFKPTMLYGAPMLLIHGREATMFYPLTNSFKLFFSVNSKADLLTPCQQQSESKTGKTQSQSLLEAPNLWPHLLRFFFFCVCVFFFQTGRWCFSTPFDLVLSSALPCYFSACFIEVWYSSQ